MVVRNDNDELVTVGNYALPRFVDDMVRHAKWVPTGKGVWCNPYKSTGRMLDELAVYR